MSGAEKLKKPFDLQARFVILVSGRLGLRGGEISHIKKHWLDFDREMINIPYYESCDCGYCYQQAKQEANHNENLTIEEAMENRWHTKTEQSARTIPYSFSERIMNTIDKFFKKYDKYPRSRHSVNRRIEQAKRNTDLDIRIYPHALRATAATHHAYRGLPGIALQNLMGWTHLKTAQKYLRKSAGATKRALDKIYKGDKNE